MTFQSISPSGAASTTDCADPVSTTLDASTYECYCGLGPACPIFGQMTKEQQEACTQDKRRIAQQYYRNGIGW